MQCDYHTSGCFAKRQVSRRQSPLASNLTAFREVRAIKGEWLLQKASTEFILAAWCHCRPNKLQLFVVTVSHPPMHKTPYWLHFVYAAILACAAIRFGHLCGSAAVFLFVNCGRCFSPYHDAAASRRPQRSGQRLESGRFITAVYHSA